MSTRLLLVLFLTLAGCGNETPAVIPETVIWIDADPGVRAWVADGNLRARIERPDGTTSEWHVLPTLQFPLMAPVVAVESDVARRFRLAIHAASDEGNLLQSHVDTVFRQDRSIGQTLLKLTSNCQVRSCRYDEVCVLGDCVESFVSEAGLEDFDPDADFGEWWSPTAPDAGAR